MADIDYSKRFKKLGDQMQAFASRANMSISKAFRGTAIVLFRGVIKTSPVDSGRFRANWNVALGNPDMAVTLDTDKSGNSATTKMSEFVNSHKDATVFTLTNNLPYAHKLEYGGYGDGPNTTGGYSKQAPSGCVRVNVARFDAILEEMARANR